MPIKVLPIFFYPFINTQHQVMHSSMFNQGAPASTLANSVYHQFNEILGGYNASNRTDAELFAVSPTIKGGLSMGALRMSVDLSIESFFEDLGANVSFRWQSITMLYFYDDVKSFKWFYFVEDVQQMTAGLWRFDLSLDMFKTYYQYIMAFKNVKPLRYFEKLTDYFNYNGTSLAGIANNRIYMDPLLPYPSQATEKYPLGNHIKNKTGDYVNQYCWTGLWDYYYMAFTSSDTSDIIATYRFRDNNYYIIATPHKIDTQGIGTLYSDRVIFKEVLDRSPNLLKKITSDIPPFGKDNYSSDVNTMFYYFNNDEDNLLAGTRGYITMTSGDAPYSWLKIKTRTGTGFTGFGPQSLQAECTAESRLPALDALASDLGELQVIFIRDNNPNMYTKQDALQLVDFYSAVPRQSNGVNGNGYIEAPRGAQAVNDQKVSITANLSPYDIGYVNNNKLPIKTDKLVKSGNFIYFYFTNYIIHDLVETQEVLTPVDNNDEEYVVKRSNELSRTRVTNSYYEYVYLNQNALRQKEKQLNKFNDVTTVLATVVGVGASIAGTIATGGAMAPVAIGAGVGAFNMVTNLFENEMKRREHEAMLADKKLQPLQFETGNYNASQSFLNYLPILSAYRFSRDSYFTNLMGSYFTSIIAIDNPMTRVWADMGHYTPTKVLTTLSQALTRNNYNYIQLQDVESIVKANPIPNEHYRAILAILSNGVRFSSLAFIANNTLANKEV